MSTLDYVSLRLESQFCLHSLESYMYLYSLIG